MICAYYKNAQLQNYKMATTKKDKNWQKSGFCHLFHFKTSKDLGNQLLHDLYSEVNSLLYL